MPCCVELALQLLLHKLRAQNLRLPVIPAPVVVFGAQGGFLAASVTTAGAGRGCGSLHAVVSPLLLLAHYHRCHWLAPERRNKHIHR
jgi:hypothetical protein